MKMTAELKSLRELSEAELDKKLAEARKDLFTMRMKLSDPTAPLVDVAGLPRGRKAVARIQTVINEKKRQQEKGA